MQLPMKSLSSSIYFPSNDDSENFTMKHLVKGEKLKTPSDGGSIVLVIYPISD